jgi:RNA polymerase sigma factor (sigma-70 family)
MLGIAAPSLLQHIRRLAVSTSSDEQLLAEFLARRSDEAFSALIGRHGPMVLNVCRRILHDAHAAEDVFQATFLVLANRAGAIRKRSSLAGFLHGVAYRLAVRARRRSKIQSLPDAVCDEAVGPAEDLAWKEMLGILDHELGRLSDRYRAPLVLCYLEGRTQDEAARQLGWSINTLRRRLQQGRRLLEARLRGRGITLSAALAGLLAGGAVAVPEPLRAATLTGVGAQVASTSALCEARNGISLLLSPLGKKIGALVVVAILGAGVCFGYWTMQADEAPTTIAPPPKVPEAGTGRGDRSDPLPAQGVVRLGTPQYRHGSRIESFAVSADGRLAAVASGWDSFSPARVFDLTDGRCLYSQPSGRVASIEAVGLSPDGKILAIKDDKDIHLRDATTGKEIRKIRYLPKDGGGRSITEWLTFSPDGKQIAATLIGDATCLIDIGTGEVTRTFASGGAASACVFSPDGKWLATGGYDLEDKVYFVRLWEVATGKEQRRIPAARFPTGNGLKRALAFSPDGSMLAGGGWGDARLRLWEVATGKELKVFPKIAEDIVSVAFAPDGKTVAAASDKVYLYDPATGKERLRIERRAQRLAFNKDGSVLIGAVSGAIYRWDAASGRLLTPSVAQDSGVAQMLVSADRRSVFTIDQEGDLYVWDAAGGKPPRRIVGGIERGVVASPDGRFLAWAVPDESVRIVPRPVRSAGIGSRVRLYDVAGQRVIDRFPAFKEDATVAAFLPDGNTLLTLGGGVATVRLWDVASGKEIRSFPVSPRLDANLSDSARWAYLRWTTRRAALAPDGKTLAIGLDWGERFRAGKRRVPVLLWDVTTGKAGHGLNEPRKGLHVADEPGTGTTDLSWAAFNRRMKSIDGRAFSPDGRLLVDWAENPYRRSLIDHIHVWDVATGRAIATLDGGVRPGTANAAFAPDGRTLATASADGTIRLWEVATWEVRAEFRGHRDRVTALAFGPDGRLFSGGLDTVVLGWDVRPPRGQVRGNLANAWEVLAEGDARAAFQAQGRFLAEPGKAVEWFAARLPGAAAPDVARIKALIAQLDEDDFATRERATAELKKHWPATAAALREVVAKSASAEARRRAEGIIRVMGKLVTPPRELRAVRAVEVLEWLATKEARILLHKLAKGAPADRLTREATAACKRLEGRK